jgi:hypothetical protein
MGKKRNAEKIVIVKPENKNPLGKTWCRGKQVIPVLS